MMSLVGKIGSGGLLLHELYLSTEFWLIVYHWLIPCWHGNILFPQTLYAMSYSRKEDLVSRYIMPKEDAIEKAMTLIGISELKEQQKEALLCFISGNDTFVSLPTGYGKSIIYGILSVVIDLYL